VANRTDHLLKKAPERLRAYQKRNLMAVAFFYQQALHPCMHALLPADLLARKYLLEYLNG